MMHRNSKPESLVFLTSGMHHLFTYLSIYHPTNDNLTYNKEINQKFTLSFFSNNLQPTRRGFSQSYTLSTIVIPSTVKIYDPINVLNTLNSLMELNNVSLSQKIMKTLIQMSPTNKPSCPAFHWLLSTLKGLTWRELFRPACLCCLG